MRRADRAFEHLDRRVVRTRELLNDDGHIRHIARNLKALFEGEDGLRRDGGAKAGDVAAARAALDPVDAGPFADVVAVGGAAIEQVLLQPRHDRTVGSVLLARFVRSRHLHVQPVLAEQALLDADEHGQVENGIVRCDFHQRHRIGHSHHPPKVTATDGYQYPVFSV